MRNICNPHGTANPHFACNVHLEGIRSDDRSIIFVRVKQQSESPHANFGVAKSKGVFESRVGRRRMGRNVGLGYTSWADCMILIPQGYLCI